MTDPDAVTAAVPDPAATAETRRVAVVQAAPRLFDLPETLRRFRDLLGRAAARGAQLVVFPEAFVGGYPKGATFGATVGRRDDEGRALFARYRRSAVVIPGEAFEEITAAVAAHRVHVVVGVIERDGGTLYCTALLLAPDGTPLAKHRKLVPTGTERVIWGRGDAGDVVVADSDVGRVGMAICWESYMPLYRTALYQRNVQIYCAPTVDERDVWTSSMRHIAVEGRCFVLSANQYATRADYPPGFFPPGFFTSDDDHDVIRGGSCIVDPFGNLLAGPSFGGPDLLVADLDLGLLDGAYLDLDVVGHYARPDLFSFPTG
ncbi:carbon-nitrogen hydrolase family protein [Nonomuraea jiangxiensis]|uniref:Predicted amidohydrolase n=1 Tax=Nonomuraea jiangxiensis TaxID=633440 RepID=A0A1G9NBR1_9ACTN|nr:carbon-nitrogen hydrolase family protein [Nonomuraea jiangxiensis]SDL83976.1 Predicted amidohydrolase [Nonomuraea jiangxiensis]